MTMEKRLDRLTVVYRRPKPSAPVVGIPGALTSREEFELDQLLARVGRRASGRADFSDLTDVEFARCCALYALYTGESVDG